MLMSAFLKYIFQQNLKFKKAFLWNTLLLYHRLSVSTVYLAVVYVAVYNIVQSEYSLIWKAKPLTIQIDKGKL